MITVKDIYDFLDKIAPFKSAMDFDNSGLLIGNYDLEVKKVLVCLDITNEVCDEANEIGANLIISHHPIIFKPIKNIDFKGPIYKMMKYEINAICAHTNLDVAEKGVNYHLAKSLELLDLSPLTYEKEYPLGFVGNLKNKMHINEFAAFVKEKLKCEGIRYTSNTDIISKVAVCSGTGGEFIEEAVNSGAEAFVTGEIKYSQILKANQLGLSIFDVGHFKSENVVVKPLKIMLKSEFKNIEFYTSKVFTDKIKYL